jgi:hypothetical protein
MNSMQEIIPHEEDPDVWFMDLWLHGRPEKTQEAYRANLTRFRAFVSKPLPYVTLADLQAFQDSLLGDHSIPGANCLLGLFLILEWSPLTVLREKRRLPLIAQEHLR